MMEHNKVALSDRQHHQRQRNRRPVSCSSCRLRKLKCNRQTPCNQCVKSRSIASCQYVSSTPTARLAPVQPKPVVMTWALPRPLTLSAFAEPQPKEPAGSTTASVVDGHCDELATPSATPSAPATEAGAIPSPTSDRQVNSRSARLVSTGYPEPFHRIQGPPPQSARTWTRPRGNDDRQIFHPDALAERVEFLSPLCFHGSKDKTQFFGRSCWALTFDFFDDVTAYKTQRYNSRPGGADYRAMKLLKREIYWREKSAKVTDWHLMAFRLCEFVPDRDVTDRLVHLYLSTFETTFRVLHVRQFLEQYESFWEMREKSIADGKPPNVFAAKLLTMMICVSCFDQTDQVVESFTGQKNLVQAAHGWMYAVRSWIASTSTLHMWGLDLLQIQCLMLMARQVIALDGDMVWITSGELIRKAMVMGLHREPSHFLKVSPYEGEIRRRLWATIVELDVQTSLSMGIPPTVALEEFDCNLPSNVEDECFSNSSSTMPRATGEKSYTRTSFLITLSQSLPTRLRIAQLVNSTRFHLSYDEALHLSQELLAVLRDAPFIAQADAESLAKGSPQYLSTKFQLSFFRFLTNRFLLVLHRPFALSASEFGNPKFLYSRNVCLDSSLALMSEIPPPPPVSQHLSGFYPYLLCFRGGMFRDDLVHAALSICLELVTQADEESLAPLHGSSSTSFIQDHTASFRKAAVSTVENFLEYLAHKVRIEKQACRAYVGVSMALASAKSRLTSSMPPHDRTHDSAEESNESAKHIMAVGRTHKAASDRCKVLLLQGSTCSSLDATIRNEAGIDTSHAADDVREEADANMSFENVSLDLDIDFLFESSVTMDAMDMPWQFDNY